MHLEIFCCGVRVVSFPLGKDRVHQGNCKIPVIYCSGVASVSSRRLRGNAAR